jgi:beta-aspartyl-dipeptidase (metallo-type)
MSEKKILTLFVDADVYAPKHRGKCDVLCTDNQILHIGKLDHKKLFELGIEIEVVNLNGDYLLPGIIDPHMHLLGGSGENGGFSSQTPEISLSEIVEAGITTAVGTLGVDTTMKTMSGLLAKVKGLIDEGLCAYMWTGGYDMPPVTILENVKNDIMFIKEIVGAGEIAISDERSIEPRAEPLARVIVDSHNGGLLAGKCGRTHFHVGDGVRMMQCLWDTLEYAPDIKAEWLYPTHLNRNPKLTREGIKLVKKGAYIDFDTTQEELVKNLDTYIDEGGDLKKLTISSDSSLTSPSNTLTQIQKALRGRKFKLSELWPLVTSNTAQALDINDQGELKECSKPNILVLDRSTYDLVHVFASGRFFIKDGVDKTKEKFLEESNRDITLIGKESSSEQRTH